MRIHYRETEEGIEIVRCFGTDGNIELPEEIKGRPVTRAAAYAFSARKAQEDEEVLVCETDEGRIFRQQEQLLAGDIVESGIPQSHLYRPAVESLLTQSSSHAVTEQGGAPANLFS